MFKYLLFDFDGTIMDTNQLIIDALNATSEEYLGEKLTQDEINSIFGKYLEDQMKQLSEIHYKEMMHFYREYYNNHQDEMVTMFFGIKDLLKALKINGCNTAIVSAKGRNGILHGLKKFNIENFIDVVVSAHDVIYNKPHPEPALKAMSLFNADSESTLMIGDSPYDIICGKNAGIKTVLVDWTIFPKDSVYSLNPDFIIKSSNELLEIVNSKFYKKTVK